MVLDVWCLTCLTCWKIFVRYCYGGLIRAAARDSTEIIRWFIIFFSYQIIVILSVNNCLWIQTDFSFKEWSFCHQMRLMWGGKGQQLGSLRGQPVFRAAGGWNVKGQCRMLNASSHAQIPRHVHDDTWKHLCPSLKRPVRLLAPFVFELQRMSKSSLATPPEGGGGGRWFTEAWFDSTCRSAQWVT